MKLEVVQNTVSRYLSIKGSWGLEKRVSKSHALEEVMVEGRIRLSGKKKRKLGLREREREQKRRETKDGMLARL